MGSAVMAVLTPVSIRTEKPANSICMTMTNRNGPATAMWVVAGEIILGVRRIKDIGSYQSAEVRGFGAFAFWLLQITKRFP